MLVLSDSTGRAPPEGGSIGLCAVAQRTPVHLFTVALKGRAKCKSHNTNLLFRLLYHRHGYWNALRLLHLHFSFCICDVVYWICGETC